MGRQPYPEDNSDSSELLSVALLNQSQIEDANPLSEPEPYFLGNVDATAQASQLFVGDSNDDDIEDIT